MKVELDKEAMKDERRETKDKSESLVDGPQCFVICHCCGAVVFIDEEAISERRETENEKQETEEDDGILRQAQDKNGA